MRKIYIYDTTLRDGTQGEGISLSVEDKLKVASCLDRLGVDYVEGGWPGSNPKDFDFFSRAGDLPWENARLAAFGSTRRPRTAVEDDQNLKSLVRAGTSTVTIFGKCWDYHVCEALRTTLEENKKMILETIGFLKEQDLEVIFDAEHFFDGFKNNPLYALEALQAAEEAGADWIVLCDTNGGSLPEEIKEVIRRVRKEIRTPLGIHAHNDGELAVANSLIAVDEGVEQVQGTINGFGERCGNANLCSIIPNLELKKGYRCLPQGNLKLLTETSRYVSEIANMILPNNQPFVGRSAFAHKGGIHASAVSKAPLTYEHISPAEVGNQRRILVSELAGASSVLYKVKELQIDLPLAKKRGREILKEIKEMEHKGYTFEGAEASLELLVRKIMGEHKPLFELESCKIIDEKRRDQETISEAVIKLRVAGEVVHTAAEGNGPVNALDNALRKALEGFYPSLKKMYLSDYKVRVLDETDGTGAKVRVLIESRDGTSTWSTVGVSHNIIEASWQALIDSMEYALLNQEKIKKTMKARDKKLTDN